MTSINNNKTIFRFLHLNLSIVLCCFLSFNVQSQNRFWKPADSLSIQKANVLGGITAVSWIISLTALNKVWYADYPTTKFHFFNDDNEWLQMDKIGHAYATYQISRSLTHLHRWAGYKPKTAAIIGSSIAFGFQASIEYLDGRSAAWGFSKGDIAANAAGCLLFLSQELFTNKQIIRFKESYSPSPYAVLRPKILGKSPIERYLKDYNGQTYWLSMSPKSIFKNSIVPDWLCLSFGYSVDAKLKGNQNSYAHSNGITYYAQREYLFSLDIDCTKIAVKNKLIKTILGAINAIKVPMPTLIWRNGVCYAKGIYF